MPVTRQQVFRTLVLFFLGWASFPGFCPGPVWGQTRASANPTPSQPVQEEQISQGPPTTATDFLHRVGEIRDYLQEFVDTSAVPGVSLALGVGERFTRFEAFGFADLESRRPVSPHTRFRIGSVSKTLTAAALGLLVEDGTLDLDAAVQTYVPDFPEKGPSITLRHLATHQAGIRHYRGDEALSNRPYPSVTDALAVFSGDPLVSEPGRSFSYSTYGYTLLSAAMEGATGRPFESLMKEKVLDPLGMARTEVESASRLHPQQATGYEPNPQGRADTAPETNLSNKLAGGGYVSTVGDLLKFARAHIDGSHFQPETLALLWSPGVTEDGTETPMGIGWQVAQTSDGKQLLVGGGNAIGGVTVVFVLPEDQVVVVFMTNMGNAPIRGVPMGVLRILMGWDQGPD